jgi:hypothetical protein
MKLTTPQWMQIMTALSPSRELRIADINKIVNKGKNLVNSYPNIHKNIKEMTKQGLLINNQGLYSNRCRHKRIARLLKRFLQEESEE